jgi:hypothetical protein
VGDSCGICRCSVEYTQFVREVQVAALDLYFAPCRGGHFERILLLAVLMMLLQIVLRSEPLSLF